MTGVDRPTRVRSGGPWFTRPVAWLLAVGVDARVGADRRRAAAGAAGRSRAGAARAASRPLRRPRRAAPAGARESPSMPPSVRSSKDASPRSRRWRPSRARRRRAGSSWPAPMPRAAGCRRARERLEAEVAKAPTGDAALELGFVLRDMGRREDAAKLWQAIVADRADERTPHSIFREGRALAALDQPRRASAAFQEAAARRRTTRASPPPGASCSSTSTTRRKRPRPSRPR